MATEAFVIAITTTGTREVQRDLQSIGTAGNQASSQMNAMAATMGRTQKSVDALSGSLSVMRGLLVAFSFIRAISGFAEFASTATLLSNKLTTITNSTAETQQVLKALGDVSIKTRTDLETNVDTFTRLARSTGSLHLSYQQLIDLSRGIADTVHIAGASTMQAKRALMDFAEGLAAGSLQGRQLRAMVMQLPTLGDAIAKSFGLAGAQLMGFLKSHPGALSPEAIVKALTAALPELDAMIGKTQVTIGQAFTNLQTKALLFVQSMDQVYGISAKVNEILSFVGDHIGAFAKFLVTLAGIFAAREVVVILTSMVTSFGALYSIANILTGGLLKLGVAILMLPIRVGIALWQAFNIVMAATIAVVNGVQTAFNVLKTAVLAVQAVILFFSSAQTIIIGILSVVSTITAALPMLLLIVATLGILAAGAYVAGTAMLAFLAPLAQLSALADPLSGLKLSIKDIPAIFEAAFDTIVNDFPLVTQALSDLWDDMVNSMLNKWHSMTNGMTDFLIQHNPAFALLGQGQLDQLKSASHAPTDLPTNTASGPIGQLANRFGLRALRNVTGLRLGDLDPDGKAGSETNLLGNQPNVLRGKSLNEDDAKKILQATSALENFLKQISPYAAAQAKLTTFDKLLTTAMKEHVDVQKVLNESGFAGMTIAQAHAEINKRLAREVDGVGNATVEYNDKLKLLNEDAVKYGYTAAELTTQQMKLRLAFLQSDPTNFANGIEAARLKVKQMLADQGTIAEGIVGKAANIDAGPAKAAIEIKALNDAFGDGAKESFGYKTAMIEVLQAQQDIGSGEALAALKAQVDLLDKNKIAAEALAGVYDKFDAGQKFLIQMQAINDAMAKNPALVQEGTNAIRDLQIQLLSTQTDALSGFQKGMLEAQKSMNDFASTAANAVTNAFNDLTDALTNFFSTGKLDIKKLGDDLLKNLDELAVKQIIMAPLANMLAPDQNGQGGIFGSGGLLGSIFGGQGLGGLVGGALGSSAANPMWVKNADILPGGLPGAPGGSGGGIMDFVSNLFKGGGGAGTASQTIDDAISSAWHWLGFAGGGDMVVGGQGGTDSQFVPFMATPGEIISVRRPGDAGQTYDHGPPIQVTMHVNGVSDPDGFQRSSGQIAGSLAAQLARTAQRNGKG